MGKFSKRWHSRQRRPADPYPAADRKARYLSLQALLVSRYGAELGPWLARRVADMFRKVNDPCTDNFRVADLSRPEEVEAFDERRLQGCCGSFEGSVTHFRLKRTFRFGCNYGH